MEENKTSSAFTSIKLKAVGMQLPVYSTNRVAILKCSQSNIHFDFYRFFHMEQSCQTLLERIKEQTDMERHVDIAL